MAMAERHLEVRREKEFSEISLPGVFQTKHGQRPQVAQNKSKSWVCSRHPVSSKVRVQLASLLVLWKY